MQRLFIFLAFVLFGCTPAFSQGTIDFQINFNGNPPPHGFGIPVSGARLTSDSFYAAIYLDDIGPTSGSIVERTDQGSFSPVFQFPFPVFAAYQAPATNPAFSYEQTWQLTQPQIDELMAGNWYAQVGYGRGTTYIGQITAVPEPSSIALFGLGPVVLSIFRQKKRLGV